MASFSKKASEILIQPQLSEKATAAGAFGIYVFRVREGANKIEIARSILELYKVRPFKVNLVKIPSKKRLVKGRRGQRPGYTKAYVYLRPGEKIESV